LDLAASKRWWISLPFFLALAVLGVIVESALFALRYPHDGILNFWNREITALDEHGSNFNHLKEW
jgi:hypothetical protein